MLNEAQRATLGAPALAFMQRRQQRPLQNEARGVSSTRNVNDARSIASGFTALGHNNGKNLSAQKCVGFITTLQRGTEWAATGNVTQKVPADFPTADKVSSRE